MSRSKEEEENSGSAGDIVVQTREQRESQELLLQRVEAAATCNHADCSELNERGEDDAPFCLSPVATRGLMLIEIRQCCSVPVVVAEQIAAVEASRGTVVRCSTASASAWSQREGYEQRGAPATSLPRAVHTTTTA